MAQGMRDFNKMKIGILGAMEIEVEALRKAMVVLEERCVYNTSFWRGTLDGCEVVLTCCGVGKVNAALCAAILIREFFVDAIINTGVAGSVDQRLNTLDVVLSTDVVYHDIDPFMNTNYPYNEKFIANSKLFSCAQAACSGIKDGFNFYSGRIATGDVFVSEEATKKSILERFNPLCVEMEGAAIAHACHMNNIPFLIIRTMSDNANSKAVISFEQFKILAAQQSAIILRSMLGFLEGEAVSFGNN